MSSPEVTLLESRFIRAGAIEGAGAVPLGEALSRRYGTDAHFQQAASPLGSRLAGRHIGYVSIFAGCIAFDVDGPGHKATREWWEGERLKIDALREAHPDPFVYRTRGGYRIVYRLVEPFRVADDADANRWTTRLYLPACELLADFGIEPDRSCSDLTRLFRLPYVVREFGEKREAPETIGDPNAIGALAVPDTTRHSPGVSSSSRSPRVDDAASGGPPSPRPFFLHTLLSKRGDVLEAHGDGAFTIRCPRRQHHSCGRDGDGSTLLYTPKGSGYGFVHCKHDSCADVSIEEWIDALKDETTQANRVVRVAGVGIDRGSYGIRIVCRLEPADGAGPLANDYLRVYSNSATRWQALWSAAGVEPPRDLDIKGDCGDAALELRGRRVVLEFERIAGEETVRRIAAPKARAMNSSSDCPGKPSQVASEAHHIGGPRGAETPEALATGG
jgi:hypothetical protein